MEDHYKTSGTLPRQPFRQKPFHKAYGLCHLFLFDDRNILKPALRALIALTVVFIYFQFCRYKNQFPADKLFPDFFQWGTTDRAEFLFLRKFQILFSTGTPLKRSASVALAFRFLLFFRKNCFKILCFCSLRILFQFSLVEKV